MKVSSCCQSITRVGGIVTLYYICNRCNQACDTIDKPNLLVSFLWPLRIYNIRGEDMPDVTFTHNGVRYGCDTETYRILFEVIGTPAENTVLNWGLQNGKIKEVHNDTRCK